MRENLKMLSELCLELCWEYKEAPELGLQYFVSGLVLCVICVYCYLLEGHGGVPHSTNF